MCVDALSGDSHGRFIAEIEIPASDKWQEMVVPAGRLIHTDTPQAMKDWSTAGLLRLLPKPGSDITKILFANFRWVDSGE